MQLSNKMMSRHVSYGVMTRVSMGWLAVLLNARGGV